MIGEIYLERVLHVLRSQSFSGAENVAAGIIANMKNKYDLAYTSPQGPIKNTLKKRGISFIPLDSFSLLNLKVAVKKWKPDVLHAHDFTATLKCVLVAGKIPVVAHIHQNPDWLKRIGIKSILFALTTLKVKKVIVVSPTIIENTKLIKLYKNKITVIKNIVDLEYVNKMSLDSYTEGLEKSDIAFIGRLVELKDPRRFIRIIKKLVQENPSLKAIIIGDGVLRNDCEQYVKELDLEQNVFIKGHLDNPYPLLRNSKILVMTSKTEGLPMTAIEAMALGKPIVVPNISSMNRLVDGTNGVVCDTDDQFIYSIQNILKNSSLYEEMSYNALKKSRTLFNMEQFKANIDSVYKQAMKVKNKNS